MKVRRKDTPPPWWRQRGSFRKEASWRISHLVWTLKWLLPWMTILRLPGDFFYMLWSLFISLGNDYLTLPLVAASKTSLWMLSLRLTTFWSKRNDHLLSTALRWTHYLSHKEWGSFRRRPIVGQKIHLKTPGKSNSYRNTHVSMPCTSLSREKVGCLETFDWSALLCYNADSTSLELPASVPDKWVCLLTQLDTLNIYSINKS